VIELTVLGCSGSYGSPAGGACSGYLVRAGGQALWMDCGNGTLGALQRHVDPADLTAVVITHGHPDHCVDLYGLHVLNRYGLERFGLPVYAPEGVNTAMLNLVSDWGGAFDWHEVGDGDHAEVGPVGLRFSRTDHPPPTVAVEVSHDGHRLVYTADTGPKWSVEAFAPRADLVLSEATYQGPYPRVVAAGRGDGPRRGRPQAHAHAPVADARPERLGGRGIRGLRRTGDARSPEPRHHDLSPRGARRSRSCRSSQVRSDGPHRLRKITR
jgi:glyoxylase-like metal-dependent hydrolase (beta-lactamase superfamily II)